MLKLDAKRREYDIVVIGEEPHLAYNRVGLTSYFQHRKVENLYLNRHEWACTPINCIEIVNVLFLRTSSLTCSLVISTPISQKAP